MSRALRLILLVFLLIGLAAPAAPAQIYVDADANGANDGTSWADAYTNLQDALSTATAGDEIWIAEGVYTPDPGGTDQTKSFTITDAKDGLQLYGGFDGSETSRGERNPEQHVTVLSGDIGGDDNTNADGITETAADISGDNSHHVLELKSSGGATLGAGTVVDGVTVTAGQADGSSPDGDGGGILSVALDAGSETVPTITDVNVVGNKADFTGGGQYNLAVDGATASPVLTDVVFTGNEVNQGEGGALKNRASNGGVASPQVTGAVFAGNSAPNRSAGHGGAVDNFVSSDGTARLAIASAVFVGNEAEGDGGALRNEEESGEAVLLLTNVTLAGNTAGDDGGAVYSEHDGSASSQFTNTVVWGNSASRDGDQVFLEFRATPRFTHSIVEGGPAGIAEGDDRAGPVFLDESGTSVSFANSTNLDQDPQFAGGSTAAGADGVFATRDDSLNVRILSPAVDAGTNDSVSTTTGLTGAARIQDTDGNGTATVNLGAFEAAAGPDAATDASQSVDGRSATIVGTVGTDGTSTTVTVAYRETGASSFQSVEAAESPITEKGVRDVSALVDGLTPGTEYEARVEASNGNGSVQGTLVTFTTESPVSPVASTSAPSGTRSRTATLAGSVKPGDASTSVTFEYRRTGASSFQSVPAAESPVSGTGGQAVSAEIDGLSPGTEYEVRVAASNSEGADTGSLVTFTTPSITYVDADATGAGDGTSWTDAYTTLRNALDNAAAGDELWIAEGVYTPDPSGTDETKSFTITGAKDGLELYGGFDGSETSRGERNPDQHVTVLSGDIGGDDNTNADGVTETAADISGDNSDHVLVLNGTTGGNITLSTVIDGVTITAGQDETDLGVAGGLDCQGQGSGNECSPTLSNVAFKGNFVDSSGGGLYLYGANEGTSSPRINGAVFSGNKSYEDGGAIFINGGNGGIAEPTIANATFDNNTAKIRHGGAVVADVFDGGTVNYTLTNVIFADNGAVSGGAIINESSTNGTIRSTITNAVFVGNEAEGDGGAIYNEVESGEAVLLLTNVTLAGNTAADDGGAVYSEHDGSASSQFTNTVVWGNSASRDGDQVFLEFRATPRFTHSIVEGGPAGIAEGDDRAGPVFLDESGTSVSFANSTNLDQDPQFAGGPAAGGDGVFATKDDGRNLGSGSPALDAGTDDSVDVAADLTGAARIQDRDEDGTATVNMGAYEVAPDASAPQVTSVTPNPAAPGRPVVLSGSNLGGTTGVTYGGTSVSFTAPTDTTVRTRVPTGTAAEAAFTVTTGGGSDTSPQLSLGDAPYGAGQALAFDGSGDYVKGPAVDLSGSALTMEAWVKPSQFPNEIHTVAGIEAGTGLALLRIGDSGIGSDVPQFVLKFGSAVRVNSSVALSTGEWQHVAGVYDGSEMRIYVDGQLAGSTSQTGSFTANDVFRVGRSGGGRYFFGEMDQVRVWTQALSATEVRTRARRTVAPSTAGLAAAYRFEASGDSLAYDHADAFRHGTLEGDPQRGPSAAGLGEQSATIAGGSGTVGPDGAAVAVQNAGGPLQAYRVGTASGAPRTGADAGEDFSQVPSVARRLGVAWGLSAPTGASADVTLQYGGLNGAQSGARKVVLKRDGPGEPWADVTGQFTRDPDAQTFAATGVSSFSEYAVGLSRALQIDGNPGPGDPADRGWRFVGVPTASALPAGDLRLNGTAPSFDLPSGHMLHRWADDQGSGAPTGGYAPITGAGETLQPGRGVALFLFDETPYVLDPSMTVDVAGTPALMGEDPVTVSSLSQTARWHLLANPYPTGYDLSSLTDLTESGFQAQVQRYDATSGTWILETQAEARLSIWQAFFVERTDFSGGAGATSLTFDPAGRITGAPFIGTKAQPSSSTPEQTARLALGLAVTGNGGDTLSTDAAAQVLFREGASESWDAYDATKLTPLAADYALLAPVGAGRGGDAVGKAVESRAWPAGENPERKEIPLRLVAEGLSGETATLRVRRWALPGPWRARIIDTETGSSQPLTSEATYTVELPDDSVRSAPRYELQVAPAGAELPVELAAFEATRAGEEEVRLRWQTAAETGNAEFQIQRNATVEPSGPDGSTTPTNQTNAEWTTIGDRPGAGTTTEAQTYRFTDREVPYAADTLRYRLRQVDTDGTVHPSEPITVARSSVREVQLHGSFPNPARSQATIRYALPEREEVRLTVYDVLGRRVQTVVDERQTAGRKQLRLNASRLSSGTYFYRLTAGQTTKTRKFSVVR